MSGPEGEFAFRNLNPAMYTVEALKDGFQTVTHPKVEVTLSSTQRVEIVLPVAGAQEKIEVIGGSSVLSVTATQEHGISPETLNQLPAPDEQRSARGGRLCRADARREHGRRLQRV